MAPVIAIFPDDKIDSIHRMAAVMDEMERTRKEKFSV